MATIPMKLLTVTGDERCFDEALEICTSAPAFHIENAHEMIGAAKSYPSRGGVNRYTPLLHQLDGLASVMGLSYDAVSDGRTAPELPEESDSSDGLRQLLRSLESGSDEEAASAMSAAIETCRTQFNDRIEARDKLTGELREDEMIMDQLAHLSDIDMNLEELFSLEYFRFRFGRMPRENYDSLINYTKDLDDMFFFASSVERNEVWGMYFTPTSKSVRIDNLFASLSFERVRISDRAHGTPSKAREQISGEMIGAKARLADLNASLDRMRTAAEPVMAYLRAAVQKRERYFNLRAQVSFNKGTFCIAGWVPVHGARALKGALEQIQSVSCVVEKPLPNKQEPPTMLKNPKLLKPFEEFVTMYGMPSQNEIDPTPIVAITYFLFFGMMFGDVGQGILLLIAGLLMYFVGKLWLGGVVAIVGVSASAFGVFYGSVFGFEDIIHGFNPMENINTTLFAAVAIGVVMIVICMVLNIINGVRQRDMQKVFLSPNGLAGMLLYLAAVVVALGLFGMMENLLPTPVLVGIIVVMLLLLFLAEPLSKLLKRRADWMPESKLDFALESFFELFEVILSYLTNAISFIRIGAFALSHVGMMTVVFLLAGGENGNIAVIIIGNLFVTGFEGLIVGIQVLRLEFYELFGRFYSGNGRVFENCGGRASIEKPTKTK